MTSFMDDSYSLDSVLLNLDGNKSNINIKENIAQDFKPDSVYFLRLNLFYWLLFLKLK